MQARQVLEALSKALIAIAVMLSVVIVAAGPATASPARPVTALFLAIGTLSLVALNVRNGASRR